MTVYSQLGKRIERLFYFGAVLVLLCLALIYFASTAIYMRSSNPNGYATLEKRLAADSQHLQELYDHPSTKSDESPDRVLAIQNARKKLGLPPEVIAAPITSDGKTYGDELKSVIQISSTESGVSVDALSSGISATQSPLEVLGIVQANLKKASEAPAEIWGIQTPLIVPVEYGDARYGVPASIIAYSLMIAIAPLIIWWLGSFQLTRQRELVAIRGCDDYRLIFPHILNLFPVLYIDAPWLSEKERAGRRNHRRQRIFLQMVYSLMRTFVVILISWPMLIMYLYSVFQLLSLQDNIAFWEVLIALAVGIWMSMQALVTLMQEWMYLWGKVYMDYWR
jgi:hypothetical protein